jgi:DNA-binding transcriptional LysR family regulator
MYFLGIEAFLAIVQTGSLRKAADLLHLTQATISYRLKTLEQLMGKTLIERNKGTHTVSLTAAGKKFVGIAERWRVLKLETDALRSDSPELHLAIGGSMSLNRYLLPPVFKALSRHIPELQLQFRTEHSSELYNCVERREIDVAFVKRELAVPNVEIESFYVDEMVLVRPLTPENIETKIVHPQELRCEYELYINSTGWGNAYPIWHDRWWGNGGLPRIKIDSTGMIFPMMQDPRQWAIAPKTIASAFMNLGQCVIQQLSDPPPPLVYYKITHACPKPAVSEGLKILNRYLGLLDKQGY